MTFGNFDILTWIHFASVIQLCVPSAHSVVKTCALLKSKLVISVSSATVWSIGSFDRGSKMPFIKCSFNNNAVRASFLEIHMGPIYEILRAKTIIAHQTREIKNWKCLNKLAWTGFRSCNYTIEVELVRTSALWRTWTHANQSSPARHNRRVISTAKLVVVKILQGSWPASHGPKLRKSPPDLLWTYSMVILKYKKIN